MANRLVLVVLAFCLLASAGVLFTRLHTTLLTSGVQEVEAANWTDVPTPKEDRVFDDLENSTTTQQVGLPSDEHVNATGENHMREPDSEIHVANAGTDTMSQSETQTNEADPTPGENGSAEELADPVPPSISSDDIDTIPFTSVSPSDWIPLTFPEHLQGANQEDADLIAEIRRSWIIPPDPQPLNLTFKNEVHFAQHGQDRWLDDHFHAKTGGFYVECGAFDGESISNSLYFERVRGWHGLLIEANPSNFQKLVSKHRDAYVLNACLSPTTTAHMRQYTNILSHPYLSRLGSDFDLYKDKIEERVGNVTTEHLDVQCFPLFSILAALGLTKVDFVSLDVEGGEKNLMQTLPLAKVDVDVFLIEIGDQNGAYRGHKIKMFADLLSPFGYKSVDLVESYDAVFTKLG